MLIDVFYVLEISKQYILLLETQLIESGNWPEERNDVMITVLFPLLTESSEKDLQLIG